MIPNVEVYLKKKHLFVNKWIKKILISLLLLISLSWEILLGFNNYLSAFYFSFFALAIVGGVMLYRNAVEQRFVFVSSPFSAFFSFSIYLANRNILPNFMSFENILKWMIVFGGSLIVFFLASYAVLHINLINSKRNTVTKSSFVSFFLIPFLGMCLVDVFVLLFCCFPGNIDPDCINVLKQVYGETPLSNHHPFVYTILLKKIVHFANSFLNNVNYGIMLFLIFQIVCISLIFAFCIISLFRLGLNKRLLKALAFLAVFWPQNINYSISVGKDSIFASFALLFLISSLRINKGIGNMFCNYVFFILSIGGLCYLRSNGAFICVGVFSISFIIFLKQNRVFILIFAIGILVSVFSKNLVISICNIQKPDTIEALAIPTQQIARVVSRSNDLTLDEKKLLSEIVDIDKVPDAYNSVWVDFVKDLVRQKGNQEFVKEHRLEYLKLYLSIGKRNPSEYIKAWIDETGGYFSPQESIGFWYEGIEKNEWGYERVNSDRICRKIYLKYVSGINNNLGLRVFSCISFLVWVSNMLLIKGLLKENKPAVLCGSYCIFLILSLLLTAPLNSSYRYVYSLAYILPFASLISLSSFSSESADET